MLVIINLLLFIFLLTTCFKKNIKENFIIALLLFFSITVFLTEALSLLHSLNFNILLTFWGIFTLFICLFCIKKNKQLKTNLNENKQVLFFIYKQLKRREKILFFVILLFLIALLVGINISY